MMIRRDRWRQALRTPGAIARVRTPYGVGVAERTWFAGGAEWVRVHRDTKWAPIDLCTETVEDEYPQR